MVFDSQIYTAYRKGPYAAFKKRIPLLICLFCLVSGMCRAQSPPQIGADIAPGTNELVGQSVSLSADSSIVVLGAPGVDAMGTDSGAARVYQNTNGSWQQLGSDMVGYAVGDQFGSSVSLSADGNILAVGAPEGLYGYYGSGYVRAYQFNNGSNTWTQLGSDIVGTLHSGRFGYAISLSADGSILAIGSQYTNYVRVYQFNSASNVWTLLGSDITGQGNEGFGMSISLSGDGSILAVGAQANSDVALWSGAVRIYRWNGSIWSQLGPDFNGAAAYDRLGTSVALNADGTRLAIGTPHADGPQASTVNRGRVEVHSYNGSSWSLLGSAINGEAERETLGYSVSLDAGGNTLAIGMKTDAPLLIPHTRIRLYRYNGSSWSKLGGDFDVATCNTSSGFRSVSLSSDGSIVATGNTQFSNTAINSSYVRIFATEASKVWLGTSGSGWTTGSNWTDGSAPSASDDVLISKVGNQPTASTAVTVNSVTLNSGASLIANAGLNGTVTYNRYLETDNWYLVTAPVSGETVNDIISTNILATGTNNNVGWASYDNSTGGVSGNWSYQTTPLSGTVNLGTGQGYAVKLRSPNVLPFTGTFPASDVTIALADNSTGSVGTNFNLVGNPYPSYIAGNNQANATDNILKLNGVDNSYLLEATLWLWNQGTGTYEAFNQANGALHISPGQGFFVRSVAGGTSAFSITENMQSHQPQTGDTFQRSSTNANPEIELTLSDQNRQKKTHIYYIEGTTTGFDNGYDSTVFGAGDSFSIYTRLVGDVQGQDMAIQSLPPNNYENTVVPIGVNAASGTQIHISAATANLPEGITVYLEDADNNTFTLLDQTSAFSTTLTSDSSGIGRFYLHTSPQTLSQDDPVLNAVSIYAVEDQLRIVGLDGGDVHLRLYGMLGQRVLDTRFRATGSNAIALPRLGTGLYLVELLSETGRIHKKLVLK